MVYLIVICVILAIALLFSMFIGFRFGKLLMNIEDNGEFCIDYIEYRYQKITSMVNRHEILHLDPIVMKYMNEIKKLNDDMMIVASAITEPSDAFKEKIQQLREKNNEPDEPRKIPEKLSVVDLVDLE